jgi:hypothetical protein
VAQDDNRRAALDLVEQLREMGFGDRGLDLARLTRRGGLASLKDGGGLGEASLSVAIHCESPF